MYLVVYTIYAHTPHAVHNMVCLILCIPQSVDHNTHVTTCILRESSTHPRQIPFKRTQCPYTTRSGAYRHWQYHWQSHHIVCVIVTRVLQSAHELCEICDNLFRVPYATHNKIKHLRECERWHVCCNIKRHECGEHTHKGGRNERITLYASPQH